MKKALFIMAAALMTMTQCRKQETLPVTPATDTVKMTITAGPGAKTDINTATGAITWSAGDKLYVSKNGSWLGSLTLVGEGGTPQGTFTGGVTGIGDGTTPCHFFYLGKGNVTTTPSGSTAVSISFAAQDGTLDGENGAMKYHIGYGNTNVTVTEGAAAGSVEMNTKIAMAHINFTTDGTQAYTGSVTMGGTGVSNTLTVNPDGSFIGSGTGGIQIGGGTSGVRYVTLIPTTTTDVLNVDFTGDATGSMTFANGIEANKFYGMKNAIAVTLEAAAAPKFSVGVDDQEQPITVEFSPGNLWYGKADGEGTAAFHFEANQWSTTPTSDGGWDANHVSHFKWSDAANAVTGDGNYSGGLFCASNFTVTGDSHTDWRTLTNDEWKNLLGLSGATSPRANASSLHEWKDLGNNVKGLVILSDGTENPSTVMGSISSTSDLATYGAVFLPAVGYRYGTDVDRVGSYGFYWSGTPYEDYEADAYGMIFISGYAGTHNDYRSDGYAVRLVR